MSRIFSILPELLKITSHEDNQKVELSRFRVWQSRERDILLYCAVRIWGPSAKFSHIMQSPYSQDFPGSGWQDSMPWGKGTEVRLPRRRSQGLQSNKLLFLFWALPNPACGGLLVEIAANHPKLREHLPWQTMTSGKAVATAALQRAAVEALTATQELRLSTQHWWPALSNAVFLHTDELPPWAETAHSLRAAFCFPGDKGKPDPASFISTRESQPDLSGLLDYR